MNLKLLESGCNAPGIPGFEDPIQAVVTKSLKKSCDDVHSDRMGNVIGRKESKLRGKYEGTCTGHLCRPGRRNRNGGSQY
jgi:endoglucanase